MPHYRLGHEEGQTLVYVTIALIALLAFVALAVDVGFAYSTRRHVQNAADAGALAGALAICRGEGRDSAIAVARTYAQNNGAQTASITVLEQGRGGTVTVVAASTIDTYLAGVIGVQQMNISADAEAACGSVNARMCGFAPIAYSWQQWQQVKGICGKEIIILDSNKVCGRDYVCDPAYYISGGERGWLDMPWFDTSIYGTSCHRNCGNNKLKCFLENDYPAPISLPACVLGESGMMSTDFDIMDDRAGEIIQVPLFDRACGAPGDPPGLGECGGHRYYHLVDVGCVEIVEAKKQDMRKVSGGYDKNIKILKVKVSCSADCFKGCAGTSAGGGEAGDALGVSILR